MSKFAPIRAGFAALALCMSLPVSAQEAPIAISEAFARSAGHHAKSGAAFMILSNVGDTGDTLLGVSSDVAKRVELHTHVMQEGVAKMRKIEGGIQIEPGADHVMARGGDHVMFMGLNRPFKRGETVNVVLHFERAGDVVVDIPVDLDR